MTMAVNKFSARDAFFTRLLEYKSAAVRKTAADTIREAEEHVLRSEEIVSQSMMIVERAEKILQEMGWAREQRNHKG